MNLLINRKSNIIKILSLFCAVFVIFTSVFLKYSVSVYAASDSDSTVGDFINNDINFARMVLYRDMAHGISVNKYHEQDYKNFLDGYSSGIGGRLQRYCVEELGANSDDIKKVTPIYQYTIDNPLITGPSEMIIHGIAYTYDKLIDGFAKWDAEHFAIQKNNDINMNDINNDVDNINTLIATWLLSLPAVKEMGYNKYPWSFDEVAPINNIKSIDGIIYDGGKGHLYYIPSDHSIGYQGKLYIYFTDKNNVHRYAYPSAPGHGDIKGGKRITWDIQYGNYVNNGTYDSNYYYSVNDNVNLPVAPTIINNIFNTENYHEGDTLVNTDNLYSDEFSLNYNRINGLYYIPIKVDTSKLTEEQKKNCPCEIVSLPQGDYLMLPITQDNYHMPDLFMLNQLVDNGYCTQQDYTNQFRSIMNYTVINKDGDVYNYNNETVSKDTYYNEVNEYNKDNYIPNGTDLTKIFPFCLPFDISRLLTPFNVEPVTPKFVVNFANFNKNIKFSDSNGSSDSSSGSSGGGSMDIDFDKLKIDELVKLLRTGEILLFTISLAIWFFKEVRK